VNKVKLPINATPVYYLLSFNATPVYYLLSFNFKPLLVVSSVFFVTQLASHLKLLHSFT